MPSDLMDGRALGKLKWRCRRGLLENDLIIERFFARHELGLTPEQGAALNQLMDLSDNDLLDLLLRRSEPAGALDVPEVRQLLNLMRPPVASPPSLPDHPTLVGNPP